MPFQSAAWNELGGTAATLAHKYPWYKQQAWWPEGPGP